MPEQESQASSPVDFRNVYNLQPAIANDGGREVNSSVLYVGNLSSKVDEESLTSVFSATGTIKSVKIMTDKNSKRKKVNYAFVEYESSTAASTAMESLNGYIFNRLPIRINYGFRTQKAIRDSGNYNIFVGDIASDVNDTILRDAFGRFGTVLEARVMWDMATKRSRSYGFVSYANAIEAQQAIDAMDGVWLGSRAIRCNWAKNRPPSEYSMFIQYDQVVRESPLWHCTIYIGKIPRAEDFTELYHFLQNFGCIVDYQLRGLASYSCYAFVQFETHTSAAWAIVQLLNTSFRGRTLKCSWARAVV